MVGAKDLSNIIVILGDFGDLLGGVVAFGIYLGRLLRNPYFDGVAFLIIGLILVIISGFLIRESKGLLLGQTTRKNTLGRLKVIAEAVEVVITIKKQFSICISLEEVLLQINTVCKQNK